MTLQFTKNENRIEVLPNTVFLSEEAAIVPLDILRSLLDGTMDPLEREQFLTALDPALLKQVQSARNFFRGNE